MGGGLTRRDGAEDIAEHTSAVAAVAVEVTTQVFYVLGEEGVRSKIRVPQTSSCIQPCEFLHNSSVANRAPERKDAYVRCTIKK